MQNSFTFFSFLKYGTSFSTKHYSLMLGYQESHVLTEITCFPRPPSKVYSPINYFIYFTFLSLGVYFLSKRIWVYCLTFHWYMRKRVFIFQKYVVLKAYRMYQRKINGEGLFFVVVEM